MTDQTVASGYLQNRLNKGLAKIKNDYFVSEWTNMRIILIKLNTSSLNSYKLSTKMTSIRRGIQFKVRVLVFV